MKVESEVILTVDSLTKTYSKDGSILSALENVSFALKRGEVLGVIGRNGAGKSTLLKVLSRITAPTSGEISYEGQLTSIIDIGTGFHADLSGEENIYLSALLLGYSKKEIKDIYNQIVYFSGLEEFIKMPVKQYSSGMYLRLAFSIAFHSNISILLLDEVIAVGDTDFKRKCYAKIQELKARGVSIILVSHHLELIVEQCDHCILLDSGRILNQGIPVEVVDYYLEMIQTNEGLQVRSAPKVIYEKLPIKILNELRNISGPHVSLNEINILVNGLNYNNSPIYTSDRITIQLECEKLNCTDSFEITFYIKNLNGVNVLMDSYCMRIDYSAIISRKGSCTVECDIPSNLLTFGVYTVGIILGRNNKHFAEQEKLIQLRLLSPENMNWGHSIGALLKPHLDWRIKFLE